MSLTPREQVVAQIEHRETEYVPYTIRFEDDVAERLDGYYGRQTWRGLIRNSIDRVPGPGLTPKGTDSRPYTDQYGSRWRVDLRPWHLLEPALPHPSLDGFAFPEPAAIFQPTWKETALQFIESYRDRFLVVGFGFGLFERTWALRGFEQALMDTALHPDFYDELVEQVTVHQLAIIDRLLELPVDGIMFSDDWGYQQGVLIGPERWRQVLKPRLARMYARVHQAGKYVISHCCGSIVDILPDLIDVGLDVLESVQPEARGMKPYELKQRFGHRLTFWGGLGSQSVIPFGTPDQVRDEIARLSREMSRGGGYILSPAKALMADTPTENAAALVEAFLEQSGVTLSKAG